MVTKCDICKKDTKGKYVVAGAGFFHDKIEVCYNCGKVAVTFLKKHNIVKQEKKKYA